jgi:uncharacterized damage-inducible protein DinB
MISETPERIGLLVKGMEEDRLHYRADVRSWSVNDILAHLRSCADLWTHSIYAMLAESEPALSDIDERKWAKITRYAELAFFQSLQAYSLQRESLVSVLINMPFDSWERSALMLERRHTVFTQTRRMAKHETEHLEQIEALLRGAGK